jgi:hypothetical protein
VRGEENMIKKRFCLHATSFLLVSTVIIAGSMNVIGSSSFGAMWAFDEGSGDIAYDSLSGNDAIIHGATWTSGVIGSALSFDGNDSVLVPDSVSLDITSAITVSAWIFPFDVDAAYQQEIVAKSNGGGYPGTAYELDIRGDGRVRWLLGAQDKWTVFLDTPSGVVKDHTWYYIAASFDGTSAWTCVNAIEIASMASSGSSFQSNDISVGIGWFGAGTFGGLQFRGIIDEVSIVDYAVTCEEIEEYYEENRPVVQASVDIDPDSVNLRSEGRWITCYIELPEPYDPRWIDASTVLLNDLVAPVLDDRYGFVKSEDSYILDYDGNGIEERMVKFSRAQVSGILDTGDLVEVTVYGEMYEGMPFEGVDVLMVFST